MGGHRKKNCDGQPGTVKTSCSNYTNRGGCLTRCATNERKRTIITIHSGEGNDEPIVYVPKSMLSARKLLYEQADIHALDFPW